MNQVLILTRNILAEQEIQQKLQSLNYEVYCSATVFESYQQQQPEMSHFFKYFQYVVLSESICESEMTALIPLLRQHSLSIVRKVETLLTKMDQNYLENEELHAIISTEDSIDELRECFYHLRSKTMGRREDHFRNDKVVQLSGKVSLMRSNTLQPTEMTDETKLQIAEVLHRLSPIEIKIVSILIEAESQVVTREELCHRIWNDGISKSHLASLSSTVTRIKSKFEQTNLESVAIHTLWGKGYRVNQRLFEKIKSDEKFYRMVLNG